MSTVVLVDSDDSGDDERPRRAAARKHKKPSKRRLDNAVVPANKQPAGNLSKAAANASWVHLMPAVHATQQRPPSCPLDWMPTTTLLRIVACANGSQVLLTILESHILGKIKCQQLLHLIDTEALAFAWDIVLAESRTQAALALASSMHVSVALWKRICTAAKGSRAWLGIVPTMAADMFALPTSTPTFVALLLLVTFVHIDRLCAVDHQAYVCATATNFVHSYHLDWNTLCNAPIRLPSGMCAFLPNAVLHNTPVLRWLFATFQPAAGSCHYNGVPLGMSIVKLIETAVATLPTCMCTDANCQCYSKKRTTTIDRWLTVLEILTERSLWGDACTLGVAVQCLDTLLHWAPLATAPLQARVRPESIRNQLMTLHRWWRLDEALVRTAQAKNVL